MEKVITFIVLVFWGLGLFSQVCDQKMLKPEKDTLKFIEYPYFILGYSGIYKQPGWVSYELVKNDTIVCETCDRNLNFRSDKGFNFSGDYKNSGYDRGHLAPSADFRSNSIKYKSTFVYTNCSPQSPSFNRGIWRELEKYVREMIFEYDNLYIITGPILCANLNYIGKNKIAIPNYFYKVVIGYKDEELRGFAWFIPNEGKKGNFDLFRVKIDFVEAVTGYDFFMVYQMI